MLTNESRLYVLFANSLLVSRRERPLLQPELRVSKLERDLSILRALELSSSDKAASFFLSPWQTILDL